MSQLIPVRSITKGRNPRRYFDPVKMAELEQSIRATSLLTPILLRPITIDGTASYQLIAGERRLISFIAVHGESAEIPALVQEMTDEQARAAALTENVVRAAMSPVEEAEAAAQVLGDCLGDRTKAAEALGWKPAMLDRRLALMYASDKVREALQERKIDIGHAELLAGCRKESQDAALDSMLAQPKLMTVLEFKAYIERAALHLEHAIFAKDECAGCHHNSGNQGALFGEAISDGRCTNKLCYETKTEAELTARAEALKDEFQVVRIVKPGEHLTLIPLVAEGPKGVGAEQALACKTCKSYGAVVSAVPDKLGKVFKNLCMDVPCNTKHVQARVKAEQDAKKASEAAAKAPKEEVKGNAPSSAAGAAKQATKPEKAKVTASAEPSNRVKENREEIWRKIFARAIPKLTVQENRSVLLAICLTRPSVLDSSKLKESLKPQIGDLLTSDPLKCLEAISKLDSQTLSTSLASIAATVSSGQQGLELKHITSILKFYTIEIERYWKLNKTFCDLLTKNELDAIAEELGIKAAMGDNYAKARNGGKDDFVKAVLNVPDFKYEGRIPALMRY